MMKGSSNSNKETDDNNDVLPLKPCYVDPPEVVSARYKPENRLLELQGDSSIPYLHSSKLSNKKSNLAVGVIKNNEMHITSIQDVFQLRPSFQHLQQDNELESFIDIDEDEPVKTEDENSFKTKANPTNKPLLQTRPATRRENERSQSSKKKEYNSMKSKEENEPWRTLDVHNINSQESQQKISSIIHG